MKVYCMLTKELAIVIYLEFCGKFYNLRNYLSNRTNKFLTNFLLQG